MSGIVNFECLAFHELSLMQLYEALALRQEVFVVEQACYYKDADGKDKESWHLLGTNSEKIIVAYARILPKGVAYPDYPAIGRIITAGTVRGKGVGRQLVAHAIEVCESFCGRGPIKIGAQAYLEKFYQSFGFEVSGDPYLEDGIPHLHMIRP
jgi:ElaA protein